MKILLATQLFVAEGVRDVALWVGLSLQTA